MKEFLHFLLPRKKLHKNKLILLCLVVLVWTAYNLPFFENTFQRRLFAFSWDFWRDCYFFTTDPLSRLLNEMISIGYASLPGTFITVLVLTGLFLFCSYHIGGRYAPFLLPLWFVMWPSADNAQQEFMTGSLVSMLCLTFLFSWISYREVHKPDKEFYYEAFHLPFWIYYTLVTLIGFRLVGLPTLLFTGTVIAYRLCILFASISWKNSANIESAAIGFTIYFITGFSIAMAYPKVWVLPSFLSDWNLLEWSTFAVFGIALLLNLIRNTSHRKVSSPHTASWIHLALGLAYGLTVVFFSKMPLEISHVKAENACQKGNYAEVLRITTRYFDRNPYARRPVNQNKESRLRTGLAAQTRLAMIMQGTLNSRFFDFRHVKEMQGMYPNLPDNLPTSNFALSKTYYETELYGSALNVITHTCEQVSPQRRLYRILIPIEAATYQKELLDRHIPWLKKAPLMRNFAKKWQKTSQEAWDMGIHPQKAPIGMGLNVNTDQRHIDRLIIEKGDMAVFGGEHLSNWGYGNKQATIAREINLSRPFNQACLEYYTLLCLLGGHIETVPELVEAYRRLEIGLLPDYLQEAALLHLGMHRHPDMAKSVKENGYKGYPINPEIIDKFIEAEEEIKFCMHQRKLDSLYGDTYLFYYRNHIERPSSLNELAPLRNYCPEPGLERDTY